MNELFCFWNMFLCVTLACRFHYYSVSFFCITLSIVPYFISINSRLCFLFTLVLCFGEYSFRFCVFFPTSLRLSVLKAI